MPQVPDYPEEDWMLRLGREDGSRQRFAQSADSVMSLKDTESAWGRSGEMSKNYPYEHETRDSIMKQLDDVGEAIIRKGGNLHKDLKKNPLRDYDMMEMHPGYFQEPMDEAQKKWFDEHGGMIYLKRKPLTT